MTSQPRNPNNDDKPVEPSTRQLSSQEYREWVQSQIANRLFLKLSAIGIGTLLIIAASYIAIQERILESSKRAVTDSVVTLLRPEIRTEVLSHLVDRSEIIKTTEKDIGQRVRSSVEESIRQKLKDPTFTDDASKELLNRLQETGGVQDLILQEAAQSALNQQLRDSTRAIGLQLYTLLHAGQRASERIEPMRKNFVHILEKEPKDHPFPPKLLTVIIENYPIGEYSREDEQSECYEQELHCKEWDMRTITNILSMLKQERRYPIDSKLFREFFGKVSPDQSTHVLQWVRMNSQLSLAKDILLAMLQSDRDDVNQALVEDLTGFITDRETPELRNLALEAFATLNPNASLDRTTRLSVIKALWRSATDEELREAFSVRVLHNLVETVRQSRSEQPHRRDYNEWRSEDLAAGSYEETHAAQLFRLAVVGLLRTALGDNEDNQAGKNDPDGWNDWELIFRPLSGLRGGEANSRAYVAWSLRMAVDLAEGENVEWAADRVLLASPAHVRKNDLVRLTMEIAVAHCSDEAFDKFAQEYTGLWLTEDSLEDLIEFSSTLIARDQRADEPYRWLSRFIRDEKQEGLFDHILDAIHGQHVGATYAERIKRLRRAVSRVEQDISEDRNGQLLAKMLIEELVRRAGVGDEIWEVATAFEEEGWFASRKHDSDEKLLKLRGEVQELRALLPWLGVPIGNDIPLVSTPGEHSIRVPIGENHQSEGGAWYRVRTDTPLMISVAELPRELELVVMNEGRSETFGRINRHMDKGELRLHVRPGMYAVAFRATDYIAPESTIEITVTSEVGPNRLAVGSADSPMEIVGSEEFLFESRHDGGEIWLAVELPSNSRLEVETGPSDKEEPIVSPYLILAVLEEFEPELYEEVLGSMRQEDSDVVDRWEHVRWYSRDAFSAVIEHLKTTSDRYGRWSTEEEVGDFAFVDDIMDGVEQSVSDISRYLAVSGIVPDSSVDGLLVEHLIRVRPSMSSWLESLRGPLEVDTYISLYDRNTGEMLGEDDDGGNGRYSFVSYEGEEEKSLSVRISRCCPEPFQRGDDLSVKVRVN